MKIAIVGAGNVGTTLAVLFQKAGHTVTGIASRSRESAARAGERAGVPFGTNPTEFTRNSDIVFITTPDRLIADVCRQIASAGGFTPGTVVAHTSGAHSSEILKSAEEAGAAPVSFHPLQTFANPEAGIKNLPGSFITVEGSERALPKARELVESLNCRLLEIPTDGKPLYHAAACIACNYLTTLLDSGLAVMEAAGISREDGLSALFPLIEGTLKNIIRVGTTQALTGPIARGDASTVAAHLSSMEKKLPSVIPLYKTLGQVTVNLAVDKGTLGQKEREELLTLLGGEEK